MLTSINNNQHLSSIRDPTPLEEKDINLEKSSSRSTSPQRDLLIDNKSNLYTISSEYNNIPITIDHPDYQRLSNFVDSTPKVTDIVTSRQSIINNDDIEFIAGPAEILRQSNISIKRVQATPITISNISSMIETKPISISNISSTTKTESINSQPITSMDPELRNLLRSISINNVREHTHMSLYDPHARWSIPNENLTTFWIDYCDLVDESGLNLCLAERPQQFMPLISKLVFKVNSEEISRNNISLEELYSDQFIKSICHAYQTALSEYYNISNNKIEHTVVVLKSAQNWHDKEDTITEFLLQFPYAYIDAGKQNRLIRPRVIQLLRINNLLSSIRLVATDWEQIISNTFLDEPILLYGSNQAPELPKLEITHIWPSIDHNHITEDINLQDVFVPQNHSHVQNKVVNPDIFDDNIIYHWIPIFLSIGYWCQKLTPKVISNNNTTVSSLTLNVKPTELTEEQTRINVHKDKGISLMEKALSGYHQDVVDAILHCEWSPHTTHCGLMKDAGSPFYYKYNYDIKIWEIIIPEIIEREGRKKFVDRLELTRMELSRQIHESNDHHFKQNSDITLKRITNLLGKLKTVSYINSVWSLITREITQKIIFKPYHADMATLDDLNHFNTFPGFKARKINVVTDIQGMDIRLRRLLWHIYVVWANRDNQIYYYLLSWLAYPLRYLNKTDVALVLVGDEGCGKSLIFNFLIKYVYGDRIGTMVDNFDPILQRFNGIIANKMLICVDDTTKSDSKKFAADFDKFKPKITGNFSQIERKGLEITEVLNYNSFAICSNHDIPVKLSEKDRRYIVLDCCNEFVGNREYFNLLVADCFNQEVGNLLYSYLRSSDLTMVPLLPVPVTSAKTRIIEALRPKHLVFLDEVFLHGGYSIPRDIIHIENGTNKLYLSTQDMFNLYIQWCKLTGNYSTYKLIGFARELKKYPGISDADRKPINGERIRCCYINDHHSTTLVSTLTGSDLITKPLSSIITTVI
ncbi:Hypothetical protein HVR_LOCUS312 [uncultured virus]|nr:Hypothetical protein HVR_LOCUS312 [uncultured virus]